REGRGLAGNVGLRGSKGDFVSGKPIGGPPLCSIAGHVVHARISSIYSTGYLHSVSDRATKSARVFLEGQPGDKRRFAVSVAAGLRAVLTTACLFFLQTGGHNRLRCVRPLPIRPHPVSCALHPAPLRVLESGDASVGTEESLEFVSSRTADSGAFAD
ncbi:hypothetical protein PFISCL1PPCAC_9213, partial [Pristionchus fissidentatus]